MSRLHRLTARQKEVLHWVAQGYTNKRVALTLGIAEHTVIQHLKVIYSVLEVDNRVHASRLYLLGGQPLAGQALAAELPRPHPKGPWARALLSLLIEDERDTKH